jgi:predicted DNA repair protein MutK
LNFGKAIPELTQFPKQIIMASGFFVLLDDIAAIMDDVAAMSKIATKKTAGILGDDLAVNAEKASGFISSRELPVLWAIAKGSFINKLIILPIAFLLSAFFPLAIIIILVLGGLFLAYEGAEKIYEYFFPHAHSKPEITLETFSEEEILILEKEKIKSAIVTDFILSVEIVIIALGTVIGKPILSQIIVVSIVAIIATVGVYGIVALIVRMDELGFKLIELSAKERSVSKTIGNILVQALPKVIKSLAVIGTIALILVAGGIFVHNIDFLHHLFPQLPSVIKEFSIGLTIGMIVLGIVILFKKMFRKN